MKAIIKRPNSDGFFDQCGMNNIRVICMASKALTHAKIGDLIILCSDDLQDDYEYKIVTQKSVKKLSKTEYELLQDCTHYSQCIHKRMGVVS